jgi:hypothetical protein
MNDVLNPDVMIEATRLTHAGRLAEATTLLQRMLRGETAPAFGSIANNIAPTGREPPIINAKTETIEQTDVALLNAATSGRPFLSTGKSMEPDTHGRAAAPPAPTPIREGRTPRRRWCASSSSTRYPRRRSEAQARRLSEAITKS